MTNHFNLDNYVPLACNIQAIGDEAEELLKSVYPELIQYINDANGSTYVKSCDIELSDDTECDYLFVILDGNKRSIVKLNRIIEEKARETLLVAIVISPLSKRCESPDCPVFLSDREKAPELLFDLCSLISVRRYFDIDFTDVFEFLNGRAIIKRYAVTGKEVAVDFECYKKCLLIISRPDENLTADVTLTDDTIALLPDDCEVLWNMRTTRQSEKGVSARMYCF